MRTAVNPKTGQTAVQVGDRWEIADKVAEDGQGTKAYLIGGEWLVDKQPIPPGLVNQIPGNDYPQATYAPKGPSMVPGAAALGLADAGLSAATGILGGVAGSAAAVGRVLSGRHDDPKAAEKGKETFGRVQGALTYQPRTDYGRALLEGLGGALEESKLAGLPPSPIISAVPLAAPATRQAASSMPSLPTRQAPEMAGFGAAMTDIDRLRWERAQALPVPLPLTQAMRTRKFEHQRFERETGKDAKLGGPIRERHAELNQRILQNFDAFLDQTGAEAGGLRAAGQIVNDAVVGKAKMAKAHVDNAYRRARESGEMAQPVPYAAISRYIEGQTPTVREKLAPIIKAVEEQISKNDPNKAGVIPLNALEDVRQMINANTEFGTPNGVHGDAIKRLIDQTTENAGGDLYRRARSLRFQYAKEFEDVGVIDKLMSTKPGTKDRAVAYEDVFKHTILSGSLDDVRMVRKTLQTAGDEGQQAWRELQGQTIQYIRDEVTKNVSTDTRGNPVVSAARLNRVITELDKDGKLDFVFGKRGAQNLRDIQEAAKDVLTFPPGSVNTSNTTSVLLGALGSAAMPRMPTAAAQAIEGINRMRRTRAMRRRVNEALAPPEQ